MAGENSVGAVTGKLAFDTAEAREGFKALSAEMERPIGLLEQMQIDLADTKAAMVNTTDPTKLRELREEFVATNQAIKQMTGDPMRALTQSMRGISREATLSTEAVLGLSLLMNTFSTDQASGEMKVLTESMREGVTTTVGLIFGLKAVGGEIGAMAGELGLLGGAIVTGISLIDKFGDAAEKAADKQKKLNDEIFKADVRAGLKTEAEEMKHLEDNLTDAEAALAKLTVTHKEFHVTASADIEARRAAQGQLVDVPFGSPEAIDEAKKKVADARAELHERKKKTDHEDVEAFGRFMKDQEHDQEILDKFRKDALTEEEKANERIVESNLEEFKLLRKEKKEDEKEHTEAEKKFFKDQEHDQEVLDELRKKDEKERLAASEEALRGLDELAGKIGGDFISKFKEGVEIAAEIVKILNSINAAGGFFSFLSMIGGIIASAFTGGAAGAVSVPGTLAKAHAVGSSSLPGQAMSKGSSSASSMQGSEFAALRRSLAGINGQQNIYLVGTLDGQTFLKMNQDQYDRWKMDKTV